MVLDQNPYTGVQQQVERLVGSASARLADAMHAPAHHFNFRQTPPRPCQPPRAAGQAPWPIPGRRYIPSVTTNLIANNDLWAGVCGRFGLKNKPAICGLGHKESPEKTNFSEPTNQTGAISRSAAMARKAERDCPRRRAASSIRPTRDSGRLIFTRTARERTLFRSISTRSQNPPR